MTKSSRAQRIRDPLHNLVEFGGDQFEQTIWQVIQTKPFQRLRRVRQLGFTELVFPGATHTRFAHSIGVFHTARLLMRNIKRRMGDTFRPHQANVALAAALVHDVGHGMFSHAFEDIGKKLDLPMARHERVSEELIRDSEMTKAFAELGTGFAIDVANVLKGKEPGTLYDSVVSSQFDADRLDYMQRDRLMTGVQSSGIDATWLIANLEIGSVKFSADDEPSGSVDTLVLGPKAFHAAENYVLSLFQLYPNVYLHKTTRVAEKLFCSLMLRIFKLVRSGHKGKTGLPKNHPFRLFAEDPSSIDRALALDDTVFWGALPLLSDASDPLIRNGAICLQERRLPKCIDIRKMLDEQRPVTSDMTPKDRQAREAELRISCKEILNEVEAFAQTRGPDEPQILVDEAKRTPYKKFQDSQSPLNQILIKHGEDRFVDMASLSPVVASAQTFEVCRAYCDADDSDARSVIQNIIRTHKQGNSDG